MSSHATCPGCGKQISLRKDGTLRQHTSGVPEYPGSPWSRPCPSVGLAPKEGAPE